MRLAAAVLLILGVLGTSVGADESPEQRALGVREAYEAGELDRLRALALDDEVDPWLVADAVCLAGAYDAALAFARAIDRQDAARLPTYLEKRRETRHDPAVRKALLASTTAADPPSQAASQDALAQLRGRGDAVERVLVERSYASLLVAGGRHAEALGAYATAGRHAERVGWLAMAAASYAEAGFEAYADGDLDGMLTSFERLLGVEQGRGHREGIGEALAYLGTTYVELGDHERALSYYEEADGVFTALGDAHQRTWILGNLGHLLGLRGEYARAMNALLRGYHLARDAGLRHRKAELLSSLGVLHATLHDFEPALDFQQRALAIFSSMDAAEGIAQCVGNMGTVYGDLGEFEKGLAHLERALAAYRKLGMRHMVTLALINKSVVQRKQGALGAARATVLEAVRLARLEKSEYLVAAALQNLAEILIPLGELDRAEATLEESQNLGARLALPRLLIEGHRLHAELWHARGEHARAVQAADRALEHALSLLAGLASDQAVVARDGLTKLFRVSLDAAVAWNRPEAVFSAIESARAGALLESLENRGAIRKEHIPELLRVRELEVGLAVKAAERAYQKAVAGGDLARVRRAKKALDRQHETRRGVFAWIQREARRAASVLYPVAATGEEARELLAKGEVLLLYSLLGDPAVALVVTRKALRIVRLGSSAAIRTAAAVSFGDPGRNVSADIARLRALLVEPLKLAPDVRRVLVAPDGILGYLPFGLLLGDRDVSFVPSATAYRVLREEAAGAPAGKGVLALGDPDYRAPAAKDGEVVERGGMRLVALPATRLEATRIGTDTLLGDQATKGRFLLRARTRKRWRAIHLACHGLVDAVRPSRSALALAFDRDGSSLLTYGEVFQQQLPADLAVLSACETGRGAIYRAEGIVGLTQAFMLAGAPRVLVSLWKVDDKATQALMLKFYELWNPGGGPDAPGRSAGGPGETQVALSATEALRRAQAHVRVQERWAHPYYWAAWVLWGLPY